MYFSHEGVNPFVATEDDALSTFAVDVDNGSWTLCRNYLERGALPPPDAVRVEEFVNAFDPGYRAQSDKTLVIHADGAPSRFGQGYQLLRVGLAGMVIDASERKPADLVFVVDVSGSMERENRLGAVRWALTMLLDQLQEGDRVGLVVYGSHGEVRLEPTGIEQREKIKAAIAGLRPAGSTNCYEGLKLAYAMARRTYEAGRINRLILCSDGVANNGATHQGRGDPEAGARVHRRGHHPVDRGLRHGQLQRRAHGEAGRQGRRQLRLRGPQGRGRAGLPREPHRHPADHRAPGQGAGRVRSGEGGPLAPAGLREPRRGRPRLPQRRRGRGRDRRRPPGHRPLRDQAQGQGQGSAGHGAPALGSPGPRHRPRRRGDGDRAAHRGEGPQARRSPTATSTSRSRPWPPSSPRSCAAATGRRRADLDDLAVVADAVAAEARGTEKLDEQAADLARLDPRSRPVEGGRGLPAWAGTREK